MALLLYRLPPIRDDEIRAACRFVIALAPTFFEPAPFYEGGIRTDDCHDVLSRLNPGAIEHWPVGVGRADDDISAAHDLSRRIDRHKFGLDQLRHAIAELPPVVGIPAEDLVALDPAFIVKRSCTMAYGACKETLRGKRSAFWGLRKCIGAGEPSDLVGDRFADASHSPSFDPRRRPETLRTAIAVAFFCPTNTTMWQS